MAKNNQVIILHEGIKAILSQLDSVEIIGNNFYVNKNKLICRLVPKFIGFKIKYRKNYILISGDQPATIITAVFNLKDALLSKNLNDVKQKLLFKSRFFKKETGFKNFNNLFENNSKNIEYGLSEEYLDSYMQEIVKRGFNTFLIYAGYHPFEFFLDFIGFEHAVPKGSENIRKRNLDYIKRITLVAKKYGIKTLLHHYVSHFPQTLSDNLNLGLSEKAGRLSGMNHPEIDRYNLYIYKRTIETLPELDGFLFNFESIGNAVPFIKKTLFKAIEETKKKPILFFRLWGVSDLEGMVEIVNSYNGPKGLMHKSNETNDVYYYPSCDDRVKIWKKYLPNVEFSFSMGPCHNCATNLTHVIWNDPSYINKLMKSMMAKGADSVSFQSGQEILSSLIKNNQFDSKESIQYSKLNYAHLESFCDVIWQKNISENDWIERYANWNNVNSVLGKHIKIAIEESSQLLLKAKWQFCYGSAQEGYLYPARNSFYQEPFFYSPMSFMNRIGEIPYKIGQRAWLVRNKKIKVLPNDTQSIIDYVNPSVKIKTKNNPKALALIISKHALNSKIAIELYTKSLNSKADQELINYVLKNIMFGERVFREITIGIELYTCYFAKSKDDFFKHIQNTLYLLEDTIKNIDIKITDRFNNTTSSGPFTPAEDAIEISKILNYAAEDFSFNSFQHYLASHVFYNEIRRLSRPYASVRNESIVRNKKLLLKSKKEAEKALELLNGTSNSLLYSENINAWLNYINSEIQDLVPPAMRCFTNSSVEDNEGFHTMRHDQNFRWGEKCWEDFSSYFKYQNFFRDDKMDCRATYNEIGLIISIREHGIFWKEREDVWSKNFGSVNQTGFMQIFLDIGNTGNKVAHFTLFFKGEGGRESVFEELPNGHIENSKDAVISGISSTFNHTDTSWRINVLIPWGKIGVKPNIGDIWRMNVFSNPSVKRNRRSIWCQGYEMKQDVSRLGIILFSK